LAVIGSGNINLLPGGRAAPLSDSTPNFAERIGQFRKTSLAYPEVSGSPSTVLARTSRARNRRRILLSRDARRRLFRGEMTWQNEWRSALRVR
jgi:hypothetical protein